jgi:hypothetical protein
MGFKHKIALAVMILMLGFSVDCRKKLYPMLTLFLFATPGILSTPNQNTVETWRVLYKAASLPIFVYKYKIII